MKKLNLILIAFIFLLSSCQAIVNFDDNSSSSLNNNTNVEICNNGKDDDGDGLTDCLDHPDCDNDPICTDPCTLEEALAINTSYSDCDSNSKCTIDHDPDVEENTILYTTLFGAHCSPTSEMNKAYYEFCNINEECPISSICIKNTCLPLDTGGYIDIENTMNLPSNWILSYQNNDGNFIRFAQEIQWNNKPISYLFIEFSHYDNNVDACNIFDGTGNFNVIHSNNPNNVGNVACKVVVTGDNPIISPDTDENTVTTGLTPDFGSKQQGEPCKGTEECAPGFVCSALADNASQGKCRQICNPDIGINCNFGILSCSMDNNIPLDGGQSSSSFKIETNNNIKFGICVDLNLYGSKK